MQTEDIPQKHFANISRRTQAVIIDAMFLLILFISTSFLASKININPYVKVAVIGGLVLLIEPLLVTFRGASIGHSYKGLRIQSSRTGKKLNIITSFIRFMLKSSLGLFSLVFVMITKKHQALHDTICGSIVVMSDKSISQGYVGLSEQEVEQVGYAYPSKLRRFFIIILYLLVFLVISGAVFITLLSQNCMHYERCNSSDRIVELIFSIISTIALFAFIVLGWRGQLLGARRKKVRAESNMSQ